MLRFTPRAEADIAEIGAAIAADNINAADGVYRRIMRKAMLAAKHPFMGAPRPELSATARILIEGRYVLIYEPQEDSVLVVAIVHGMRDPSGWLGQPWLTRLKSFVQLEISS
jgi:toxin ParE1/3/4